MVVYTCRRCGYSCKNKSYYKKHLLRKVVCDPIINNVSVSQLYDDIYGEGQYKEQNNMGKNNAIINSDEIRWNALENTLEEIKSNGNTLEYVENTLDYVEKSTTTKLEFFCNKCGKKFKQKRYLRDHCSRNRCGNSKNISDKSTSNGNEAYSGIDIGKDILIASQNAVIKELRSQIETLLKEKGNTYSYTQNIMVQPFGKEKTQHINGPYVKALIDKGPIHCIPNLLKAIHFNNCHRENLNIKIPNKKQQLAQIFNGTCWEYKDKKTTIDNMTSRAYSIINSHYDTGSNTYMDTFKINYENEERDVVKKITKDTEIMILNNQGIAQDTTQGTTQGDNQGINQGINQENTQENNQGK